MIKSEFCTVGYRKNAGNTSGVDNDGGDQITPSGGVKGTSGSELGANPAGLGLSGGAAVLT